MKISTFRNFSARAVDEHGVGETDDRGDRRADQHPDDGVDDRPGALGLREDPHVVVEADELLAGLVEERLHERRDAG
jgi:hypothetical protein